MDKENKLYISDEDSNISLKDIVVDISCDKYIYLNNIVSYPISFVGYDTDKGCMILPYFKHGKNKYCWSEDKIFFLSLDNAIKWMKFISSRINRDINTNKPSRYLEFEYDKINKEK